MTTSQVGRAWFAAASISLLSACGAGGGGSIASTPPPSPVPTSTHTPSTFEPVAAKIFAEPLYNPRLTVLGSGWQYDAKGDGSGPQNVRSADKLSISFDQATGNYLVTAPVVGTGTLFQISSGGADEPNGSFAAVIADGAESAADKAGDMRVFPTGPGNTKYSYVSFLQFNPTSSAETGPFELAYGSYALVQPTRSGEVPVIGTAKYTGELYGSLESSGASWIEGTARFEFDFGSGGLSGDLTASQLCLIGCSYPSITYNFIDTHFARGSTSFSGGLATALAPTDGSFSGIFAGPSATELAAQFRLPFFDGEGSGWTTAAGVILGKRD